MSSPHYAPGPRGGLVLGSLPEFRRDVLGFLLGAARDHGDMVHFRLATFYVHALNSPELASEVSVDRASEFHKSRLTKDILGRAMGNGLIVSDGDFHKRQRRLTQPAFHPKRIDGYAGVMSDCARRMVDRWKPGDEIDV